MTVSGLESEEDGIEGLVAINREMGQWWNENIQTTSVQGDLNVQTRDFLANQELVGPG